MRTCLHGRPLSICAICGPAAEERLHRGQILERAGRAAGALNAAIRDAFRAGIPLSIRYHPPPPEEIDPTATVAIERPLEPWTLSLEVHGSAVEMPDAPGTEGRARLPDGLVVSAVRYALGRATYVVQETTTWLVEHWHHLQPGTRQVIQRDVRRALDEGRVGHDCDRREWERAAVPDGEARHA